MNGENIVYVFVCHVCQAQINVPYSWFWKPLTKEGLKSYR